MTHHGEQLRGMVTGGVLALAVNVWEMILGTVTLADVLRTILFSFIGAVVGYFTTRLLQRITK